MKPTISFCNIDKSSEFEKQFSIQGYHYCYIFGMLEAAHRLYYAHEDCYFSTETLT